RIIVTSRLENDITSALNKKRIKSTTIELGTQENLQDAVIFVESSLTDILGKEPSKETVSKFVETSHGLFIWLSMAMNEMRQSYNDAHQAGRAFALETFVPLGSSMAEFYEKKTLKRIFMANRETKAENSGESMQRILGKILAAIVTVYKPVSSTTLFDLLGI